MGVAEWTLVVALLALLAAVGAVAVTWWVGVKAEIREALRRFEPAIRFSATIQGGSGAFRIIGAAHLRNEGPDAFRVKLYLPGTAEPVWVVDDLPTGAVRELAELPEAVKAVEHTENEGAPVKITYEDSLGNQYVLQGRWRILGWDAALIATGPVLHFRDYWRLWKRLSRRGSQDGRASLKGD